MSYNYWIPVHQHDMFSNAGGYFEIVTKTADYITYAKEHNLPAVSVTNHGNVAGWVQRKTDVEAAGLKYIHGIEAYVTMNLEDKNRGYHTIIIAKNYDGVKEINQLSSESFNRKDGHFYYRPRILFDDLAKAVARGNIYVTTACLAGALSQTYKSVEEASTCKRWIKFASDNKDNVFLEVQPHMDKEQKDYNEFLTQVADAHGVKLIAANDIHALNPEHDRLRKIVKKGKKNGYDNDDNFELWCKDRDEMFDSFKKQGVLTDDEINSALDITVDIANSVQEFELDRSHKYPHLYDNPEKEFQKRIKKGLKDRGILNLPAEERQKYLDRVKHEYAVYKHNGAIDYMLSHEDILNAAREHGINISYGRGSVSGSLIAYLCGQTEMDSVKLGLNFERFMNPQRVSLADIDIDTYKDDQQWIQKWMLTNPKWHAASIMTANTYGLKAAIKAIADGMDRYAGKPAYIQSIRNQIDEDGNIPTSLYEEHKQLIDDAKKIVGVIDSFGRHAAGILIDTNTIEDTMGTQTISGWDYPVTQIAMKEIESCSWVKYDMLGLDNIGLISRACKLAGLPFLTPNSTDIIDFEDKKVWESMRENNIGVFQMEGDRAGKLLRDMLSPETIANIRSNEAGKDVKYMDLLSLVNAAQRPSGSSYVDAVTHGRFKDNGHPALNKFLAPTLGFLVYQEQLIQFLVQFCGYTPGAADVLRRGVGHKIQSVIDEEIPKIHDAFVKTMINVYHDDAEHAEKIAKDFIQVFMDAANYGFSINHSMAYSYIGYISTWLRYYYPVEWCTAAFQIWKDKQEKLNRVFSFAKEHNIHVKPIRFGKSKGLYYMDKNSGDIYEGVGSVKNLNVKEGDQLYLMSDKKYKYFTDLLLTMCQSGTIHLKSENYNSPIELYHEAYKLGGEKGIELIKSVDKEIKNKTNDSSYTPLRPVDINSRALINLISLNYFKDFGGVKKLNQVFGLFHDTYKPNNKTFLNKYKKYKECLDFEKSLADENANILTQLDNETKLLGRCVSTQEDIGINYVYVTSVIERSNRVRLKLYSIKNGTTISANVGRRIFNNNSFGGSALIDINKLVSKPKGVFVGGKWTKSKTENEYWLTEYKVIRA